MVFSQYIPTVEPRQVSKAEEKAVLMFVTSETDTTVCYSLLKPEQFSGL